MCCRVGWPRRASLRSFACAGHAAAMRTQPYLGSRSRPASRASPLADGEPGTVTMSGLEPRKPPLSGEERRVRVGGVAECVPERPGGVLVRPRCHLRLLRGPELCEGEER